MHDLVKHDVDGVPADTGESSVWALRLVQSGIPESGRPVVVAGVRACGGEAIQDQEAKPVYAIWRSSTHAE